MPDQEEIASQQDRLETHRRTLAHYLRQQAKVGSAYVQPGVIHGILEARTEIRHCKAALLRWGVPVEDLPDDEPPVPQTVPEQAGLGLSAVASLMSSSDVRTEVMAFQASFKVAWHEIDRLSTYKALHDLLHELQFKCYRPIVSQTSDFPNNEQFLESLGYHEADLQEVVNSLAELADQPNFPAQERIWIAQISQAADLLSAVIVELGKEKLDQATFQIERVLHVHPTRINERLKEAARNLPLEQLISAMALVHDRLAQTGHDQDRLRQVREGMVALEQIRVSLALLIEEHDIWQMFDPELQRFEHQPEQHLQQLIWLWQDLKPAITELCSSRNDRWTQDLRLAGEKLDRALAAQTPDAITTIFHAFHSRFSLCFFRADKELKEQCFKLRLVDGPLRSVIGMLG